MRTFCAAFRIVFVVFAVLFSYLGICEAGSLSMQDKIRLAPYCGLSPNAGNAEFHVCIDRLKYQGKLAQMEQQSGNAEWNVAKDRAKYERNAIRNGINPYSNGYNSYFPFLGYGSNYHSGNAEWNVAKDRAKYERDARRNGINPY